LAHHPERQRAPFDARKAKPDRQRESWRRTSPRVAARPASPEIGTVLRCSSWRSPLLKRGVKRNLTVWKIGELGSAGRSAAGGSHGTSWPSPTMKRHRYGRVAGC